jgi:hypothetical protein
MISNSNRLSLKPSGPEEMWYIGNLPSSANWKVAYGNGIFVAVSNGSTKSIYSSDGLIWTEVPLALTSASWSAIRFGNGYFVAVASNSSRYAITTDGITWTQYTNLPFSANWCSIAFDGNQKFVAVSTGNFSRANSRYAYNNAGTAQITNGASFSPTSPLFDAKCVSYGAGLFVAVQGGTDYKYSSDGITWSNGTLPVNSERIIYGGNMFLAITNNDSIINFPTMRQYAYSYDGLNWLTSNFPIGAFARTAASGSFLLDEGTFAYGGNKFIIISSYQYNNRRAVLYSENGLNWKISKIPQNVICTNAAYGNGRFVVMRNGSQYFYTK